MIKTCFRKESFMEKLKEILSKLNFHYVFIGLMVIIIATVVFRLHAWNNRAHTIESENPNSTEFDTETLDNLVPYTYDAEPKDPEDMIIACFGNAPFADEMGKANNLANIISDKTGATVYNFAFEDSYLS